MSADTPRTNGAVFVVFPSPSNDVEAVDAGFARQLERENAGLQMQIDHLLDANRRIADIYAETLDRVLKDKKGKQ